MGWNYDPDAIHSHQSGEINALTEKTTPVDADVVVIEDSEDSWAKKKVALSEIGTGGGGGGASYAETIGDNTNTSYQVTHGLGTEDLVVQLWDLTGSDPVEATGDADSITVDDEDNITVAFSAPPATDSYRVVVLSDGRTGSGGGGSVEWMEYLGGRLSDETSHSDDRFFATGAPATPSSGTAVTPSGTATWLEGRQLLSVSAVSNATADMCAYLWELTPSEPPVTIESYVRFRPRSANFSMIAPVLFTDGTAASSNAIAAVMYRNSSNMSRHIFSGTLTNMTTNSLTNIESDPGTEFGIGYYVQLIWKAANTWTWRVSYDGLSLVGVGWSVSVHHHDPPHISE